MAKIAFVSDVVYPWTKGGMESIHYTEMRELAKSHEVYCLCLQFDGMKKEFVKDNVHYITVAKASMPLYTKEGSRSIALAKLFAEALPKELSKHEFSMVYANSFPYLHLKAVKAYCRKRKARLVLDVSEVWDLKRWQSYIGKIKGMAAYRYALIALKGADHYIANSSTTMKDLEKIGIPKEKITVFSPVLDFAALKKAKAKRREKTVVYAGRFIKEKRLDLWIDAVKKAHRIDPSIKGLIIGDGPELQNVKRSAKACPFIRIKKPFASKAALYSVLAGSMAMLNMSEREGLSVIALESAALGTPIVLPDYTPIPKEVKDFAFIEETKNIPELLARMADGKIRYKTNATKLKRFDIRNTIKVFESVIG